MNAPTLRTFRNDDIRLRFKVEGGLHMIKGNDAPYFSLTCHGYDHGSEFAGAAHDMILKHFPDLADLAALHLSDNDGAPMHALENGFYWLGGTHWQRLEVAAAHFRITEDAARQLTRDLFGDNFSETAGFLSEGAAADAKQRLAAWVDTQRPRWKAEAEACIARHGLVIYGEDVR